jgi:hypothetical protein
MKSADLQDRVNRAAFTLDMRWVEAARRVSAPMPRWLASVSSVGFAGAGLTLASFLPKRLRRLAFNSALPMVASRLIK